MVRKQGSFGLSEISLSLRPQNGIDCFADFVLVISAKVFAAPPVQAVSDVLDNRGLSGSAAANEGCERWVQRNLDVVEEIVPRARIQLSLG